MVVTAWPLGRCRCEGRAGPWQGVPGLPQWSSRTVPCPPLVPGAQGVQVPSQASLGNQLKTSDEMMNSPISPNFCHDFLILCNFEVTRNSFDPAVLSWDGAATWDVSRGPWAVWPHGPGPLPPLVRMDIWEQASEPSLLLARLSRDGCRGLCPHGQGQAGWLSEGCAQTGQTRAVTRQV